MTEILQEAREAAADLEEELVREATHLCVRIRAGKCDSHPFVQAFTRALLAERERQKERDANIGYRVCAETRHVTLGDKVAQAIRSGT